jgi:RNA:NAD 2'-phosphotransferase (TPT1/KptA family)
VNLHDDIPRWLIHGTDEEAFLKIRREGIRPMTRQHVHLATTVDVVHDYSTVLIYVDKNEVLRLGMELLLSGPAAGPGAVRHGHSGVVLCRSVIPPSCFKCAWHIAKEIDLLHHTGDDWWVEAEEVETTTRWKQIRLGE